MKDLSITVIQSSLHWENITANLAMFEEKIWSSRQPADIIVLPEMFSTGYSMNAPELAEMMNMQTTKWIRQMADHTGALILGSFMVKEKGLYYNRLLWMEPGGSFKTYDKRHTFRMAREHDTYASGNVKLIASWKGWNICPMVCYDLRFPVWSRNTWDTVQERMAYDVLIYVASWPESRVFAWDTLLRARAIENLTYVVGVNRTGNDGNQVPYNGHSVILDPRGTDIIACGTGETVQTAVLSSVGLSDYRAKFPAYLDADPFQIG